LVSDLDNDDAWTAAGCKDLFPADEHANEQIAKNNAWIAEKERQAEEWAKDFNKAHEIETTLKMPRPRFAEARTSEGRR
jgi:hypothetical protein